MCHAGLFRQQYTWGNAQAGLRTQSIFIRVQVQSILASLSSSLKIYFFEFNFEFSIFANPISSLSSEV